MVIIPTRVSHTDEAVWGPTAGLFDYRRFLRSDMGSNNNENNGGGKRVPAAAFRGFGGGGAMLCPGRHFVSTEILAFVALLLVRFDVRPVGARGGWVEPRKTF